MSTKFKKGNQFSPGRRPGSKGRLTRKMKEMLEEATHLAGDQIALGRIEAARKKHETIPKPIGGAVEYLTYQALAEPSAFMGLIGRTIEKQIKIDATPRSTMIFRDFTGLKLEQLGPSILKRIEKEMAK